MRQGFWGRCNVERELSVFVYLNSVTKNGRMMFGSCSYSPEAAKADDWMLIIMEEGGAVAPAVGRPLFLVPESSDSAVGPR